MSQLGTVYATKRRRRNGKSLKPPPKDGVTKSNPSKRHRERLNAELDLLASLLPFEQNILSKLDRLSILRLSVSYLRTKSYFQVVMHKDKEENGGVLPHIHAHDGYRTRELGAFEHGLLDGDMFLQALNGFLMILTCEGEVFFATHSIESYLGFHQSDIVHQSVYELVHSEDREELQRQLLWNSFLPADMTSMQLAETLAPDKALYLERSFTVRFRCLLDNTSGFLRLDIRGRIKILHGQNRKTEEPPLALFAYCTPFGPPSLLEIPHKENMFKSKHKLDFSLVSMDQRGKHILGYSDGELINMGGYDLVHYDDLAYVASAHQELLKTGASGMIAYRYQKKDGEWQWLQTSSRLVYKNSKPDFVICTHRQLMDEEGHDLLGKRTMDFKVSYLDTGLASTYFSEADQLVVPSSTSPNALPPPITPTRPNRRYKTQLRDFLSTCRTKRKMQQQTQQNSPLSQVTSPAPVVEYLPDPAVAVAAAYSNLNPMYTTSPYAAAADNIYMGTSVHSTNAFYPVTENLFHQYRLQGVGGYYTDYHHSGAPASAYVANGFLSYDGYTIASKTDDKWQDTGKYYSGYSSGYGSPTSTPQQVPLKTPKSSPQVMEVVSCSSDGPSPVNAAATNSNVTANGSGGGGSVIGGSVTPKVELGSQDTYERQTVLMWGTTQSSGVPLNNLHGNRTAIDRAPQSTTPLSNGLSYTNNNNNNNNNNEHEATVMKWNSSKDTKSAATASTPESYQLQHDDSGLYSASSHTTSPQQRLGGSSSSGGGPTNVSASSVNNPVTHEQHSNATTVHNTTTTAVAASAVVVASSAPGAQQQDNQLQTVAAGSNPHMQQHAQLQQQQQQQQHVVALHAHQQQQSGNHHPHHHHHQHAQHHTHPHAHALTHAHHGHHAHAHAHAHTTNGSEQHQQQQQQQQLHQHQLNYVHQLHDMSNCNSATATSSSTSPVCTSPTITAATTQQQQQLPSVGSILNGGGSNSSGIDAVTTSYHHQHPHQLAIITSSPIVISSATLSDADNMALNATPLQPLHSITLDNPTITASSTVNVVRGRKGTRGVAMHALLQQQQQQRHQQLHLQQQQVLYPTTTTPKATIAANNTHTLAAYTPASNAAYETVNAEQQLDGSPLLSFSEVTNTLLNQ